MQIKVTVPKAVAIKGKLDRCGDGVVEVPSWDGWSDEERAALARLAEPVEVETYTAEALLARVRAEIAREAQTQQKAAAETARRAELLAALPAMARARIEAEGIDWATSRGKYYGDGDHERTPLHWLYAYPPQGGVEADEGYHSSNSLSVSCEIPDDLLALVQQAADKANAAARAKAERLERERAIKREAEEAIKQSVEEVKRLLQEKKAAEADWLFLLAATDEQKARHAAGYLPVKERDQAVRDHVFAALATVDRYARLDVSDINHRDDCSVYGDDVAWDVEDTTELTAAQYAVLVQVKGALEPLVAANEGWRLSVEPQAHVGECQDCHRKARAVGILATVTTARGNEYSREFATPRT
jgi:hypothetical protein